jgi:glycosyltransferase involved in cell wall biosynthesis
VELTVVMPCLNEAETVATCVRKAVGFLHEYDISGEVVVADNGSTDGSQQLATDAGARVVPVSEKGYGNALMGGIVAARGRFIIMGDADDSYDFTNLMPFIEKLRDGADLVMGNRFEGGIEPGAMPALHRYIGNPVLSFIGRLFFNSKIGDFHCGLRGFRRDSVMKLGLQATGMEFASELVVKATLAKQRITEVPTTLAKDGRSRPPHLRSWRDGWRHLRFLLLFSPRWLFFMPGLAFLILGLVIGAVIIPRPFSLGSVTFDVDTLVAASAMIVIGFQSVLFALFTQVYASAEGFLPEDKRVRHILKTLSLERGLVAGGVLAVAGIVGLAVSLSYWGSTSFGSLDYNHALRLVVPSVTALIVSCQIILGTFFLSILGIRRTRHPAMGALETDEEGREAAPGKITRTRPDNAVGTVGVDTGAPAAIPAHASAHGGGSANGGMDVGAPAGADTAGAGSVPAGAGSDVHAAGSDGA